MIFQFCKMAKRKFRKVYLIVNGNQIFGQHNYEVINAHRRKSYAESICASQNKTRIAEQGYDCNKNQPLVLGKVHGYYLVHESYFEGEDS